MVSIKGRVIEQATKGADEHLKKLVKKYLGIGRYYYRKPSHKPNHTEDQARKDNGPINSSCILFPSLLPEEQIILSDLKRAPRSRHLVKVYQISFISY